MRRAGLSVPEPSLTEADDSDAFVTAEEDAIDSICAQVNALGISCGDSRSGRGSKRHPSDNGQDSLRESLREIRRKLSDLSQKSKKETRYVNDVEISDSESLHDDDGFHGCCRQCSFPLARYKAKGAGKEVPDTKMSHPCPVHSEYNKRCCRCNGGCHYCSRTCRRRNLKTTKAEMKPKAIEAAPKPKEDSSSSSPEVSAWDLGPNLTAPWQNATRHPLPHLPGVSCLNTGWGQPETLPMQPPHVPADVMGGAVPGGNFPAPGWSAPTNTSPERVTLPNGQTFVIGEQQGTGWLPQTQPPNDMQARLNNLRNNPTFSQQAAAAQQTWNKQQSTQPQNSGWGAPAQGHSDNNQQETGWGNAPQQQDTNWGNTQQQNTYWGNTQPQQDMTWGDNQQDNNWGDNAQDDKRSPKNDWGNNRDKSDSQNSEWNGDNKSRSNDSQNKSEKSWQNKDWQNVERKSTANASKKAASKKTEKARQVSLSVRPSAAEISRPRPYWNNGLLASSADSSSRAAPNTKRQLTTVLREEPLRKFPKIEAENHQIAHQVRAGVGVERKHKTLPVRPEFKDSKDKPYAVFRFKYRSEDKLKEILGKNEFKESEEDMIARLKGMTQGQIIAEILETRKQIRAAKDDKSAKSKSVASSGKSQSEKAKSAKSKGPGSFVADGGQW
jgi:hypothetical protein